MRDEIGREPGGWSPRASNPEHSVLFGRTPQHPDVPSGVCLFPPPLPRACQRIYRAGGAGGQQEYSPRWEGDSGITNLDENA